MGPMVDTYENLVGGQWITAKSGRWFERRNPAATSEVVGRFPSMGSEDAAIAIDAATQCFPEWKSVGLLARSQILLKTAEILRSRSEEIAHDITCENGKTLAEARGEAQAAATYFEYFGSLARTSQGDVLADRRGGVRAWTQREPLGVVVLISPWNDPVVTPARKLAPSLLCGNTVVLKPAAETPVSAHHLARALDEAGAPPGAVNVVTGPAEELGPALLNAEPIRAVSFTGSTAVGLMLSRLLAGRPIRLQTEMGGKNAVLVLPDADLDLAADTIASAGCGQGGQRCTATSRVVVHAVVADALGERLADRLGSLRVGRGDRKDVQMGPMVTQRHLDSVLHAVESARASATRIIGGQRLTGAGYDDGYFLSPALVVDAHPRAAIWHEEIFGPVLSMVSVSSYEKGVRLVNESRYGLSAGIFTADLGAAHRFIEDVETGQVAVNLPTTGWDVHVPFGGFKESGSPFKENGVSGLDFYSRRKSITVRYW